VPQPERTRGAAGEPETLERLRFPLARPGYTSRMAAGPKLPPSGFDELSAGEKVDYINALWAQVLVRPESIPVPDWHREIIAERLAEYRAGKAGRGRPWAEVRRDLQDELRKARG